MSIAPPGRQNSAGRIETLILRGDAIDNVAAVEGWAQVFNVPSEMSGLERHHEVAKLLSALIQEIRLMERQLTEVGVPDDLRAPFADQLAQAASIGNMNIIGTTSSRTTLERKSAYLCDGSSMSCPRRRWRQTSKTSRSSSGCWSSLRRRQR